ncbi:MAG: hypothetical protein AAFY71_07695 [Bacteroidota bacterium]
MKRIIQVIFPFCLLLMITGCEVIQDPGLIKSPDWDPEFAVAVINTEMSLQDALDLVGENAYIEIDNNGAIGLTYETNLIERQQFDLIELPDVTIPMPVKALTFPFPVPQVDEVSFKQGSLSISFQSATEAEFDVLVTIPEFQENGLPLSQKFTYSSTGSYTETIDLSTFDLVLDEGNMSLAYQATRRSDNQPIDLDNVEYSITNLSYNNIKGNFRRSSVADFTDSLQVDFDESLQDIQFSIAEPSIKISVHSSLGVPLQIQASDFGLYKEGESPIQIASENLRNGINLFYPTVAEIGQTKTTNITIDYNNSDIEEALSTIPDGIFWSLGATVNPEDDSTFIGFLTDSSSVSVDVAVNVPFKGSLSGFEFSTDVEMDLEDLDVADKAGIRLITENRIPIELGIQVYMMDENDQLIDSVFNGINTLLEAASVGDDGFVNGSGDNQIDMELNPQQWDHLVSSSKLRVKAKVQTTAEGTVPVQFSTDNSLSIKMGVTGTPN